MLDDIFKLPKDGEKLSRGQENWLRMISSVPEVKELMNDPVTEEDRLMAQEAAEIIQQSGAKGDPRMPVKMYCVEVELDGVVTAKRMPSDHPPVEEEVRQYFRDLGYEVGLRVRFC